MQLSNEQFSAKSAVTYMTRVKHRNQKHIRKSVIMIRCQSSHVLSYLNSWGTLHEHGERGGGGGRCTVIYLLHSYTSQGSNESDGVRAMCASALGGCLWSRDIG